MSWEIKLKRGNDPSQKCLRVSESCATRALRSRLIIERARFLADSPIPRPSWWWRSRRCSRILRSRRSASISILPLSVFHQKRRQSPPCLDNPRNDPGRDDPRDSPNPMKCFYDSTQDAVGSCKSCGRGLSHEHLSDMDRGLACKDRCEDDVRSLITLTDGNVSSSAATNQILKRSSSAGYGSGVFLTLMGIVFGFTGLKEPHLDFTLFLGMGFVVYGIWILVRAHRHAGIVAGLPDSLEPSA